MNSILLDDKFSESLSDDEETALIELMACCCRQAATGKGPSGRFVKRVRIWNYFFPLTCPSS